MNPPVYYLVNGVALFYNCSNVLSYICCFSGIEINTTIIIMYSCPNKTQGGSGGGGGQGSRGLLIWSSLITWQIGPQ